MLHCSGLRRPAIAWAYRGLVSAFIFNQGFWLVGSCGTFYFRSEVSYSITLNNTTKESENIIVALGITITLLGYAVPICLYEVPPLRGSTSLTMNSLTENPIRKFKKITICYYILHS